MDLTAERTDGGDAFRRLAEIALAGLLHDVGKIFQRAEWPLSQDAEKLQDDLCPVIDSRAVHRHVLWTYDFCSDNLRWLAEYVDLARVIRLATAHHKTAHDDPAALILDAADRIAAGAQAVEVEELQPVIPPQVPLESILWNLTAQAAPDQPAPLKSRRRRRQTSDTAAASEGPAESAPQNVQPAEPALPGEIAPTGEGAEFVQPQPPVDATQSSESALQPAPLSPLPAPPESGRVAQDSGLVAQASEPAPQDSSLSPESSSLTPEPLPRFDAVRRGFFKPQILTSDEDVLPTGRRPEMNEQNYRQIGTDLIAAVQKIGRMTGKPRLDWLMDALRGALEQRTSLVPAYVGSAGQTVSLYSHAVAMSAVAAALWRGFERTGSLPAGADARTMSLTLLQVTGARQFISRPAPTENSARVFHGRAMLVRLITRLSGDLLLKEMGMPVTSRLWEGDDSLVILADASEAATLAVQRFAAQQGTKIFEQTAGHLQLAVAEPVALSHEQFAKAGWAGLCRDLQTRLDAARCRPAGVSLQSDGKWRAEAALLTLTDWRGQPQEPGDWLRLQEAYERQLGTNSLRGKMIAVYNSPVTPVGVEGEPTAIGPWFVHVGLGPEAFPDLDGIEAIYATADLDEPWGWVPLWHGLPHGPTYRRADESQLRADWMPQGWRMAAGTKRRDTPIGFEELGWLARRSRRGRGFVGRSWLACLQLQADGIRDDWCSLVRHAENLGQIVETGRQGQWFWQNFVTGQLRRSDRATWRVFVLRCGLGSALLIGPWNTMMVLAARAEQWWRRWAGPATPWPVRGAMAFGPRDVPPWQLLWQTDEGLIQAEPADGAGSLWLFDRLRNWTSYREALRLSNLLDEQTHSPDAVQADAALALLRRLLRHERQARGSTAGAVRSAQTAVAWRAELAMDVRKLLLRHLPRRQDRTPAQEELIEQLQSIVTTGRRGRFPAGVALAARIALWQNQGESS